MNKTGTWALFVIVALLGTGLVWWGFALRVAAPTVSSPAGTSTAASSLATSTLASGATWPVELTHLKTRLTADNLPALATEGTVLHIHQHLDLFINGKTVAVPAGIGIDEAAGFISPIHVHDTTGILHVESPYVATFTLGEFFDVWGVRFTNLCIGGYCSNERENLLVYVNGKRYQGDPRQISLTPHEEIAVVFGTASDTPASIPASYAFPAGY